MTQIRPLIAATAILFAGALACSDDNNGGAGPDTQFATAMTGDEEVPAVVTTATGTAEITVNGAQIDYTVNTSNLQNPVVSHIHIAEPGANGPVRLNLCGTTDTEACGTGDGELVTGSNGATLGGISFDSLVSAIRAGNAYVNVHTDDGVDPQNTGAGDMASGEIRGQLEAQ